MRNITHQSRRASILLLAIAWVAILTIAGASTILFLRSKHQEAFQTSSWQEALLAAESGTDLAVNEMRKGLFSPTTAWTGWNRTDGTTGPLTSGSSSVISSVLERIGEGGQRSWAEVQVDAPDYLKDASGEQWYRIRSIGYSEIPGGRVVAGEKPDNALRKLSLNTDRRTGQAVPVPRASRLIEAIAKPVGTFRVALLSNETISMNNHNIVVDSYDSRDPSKSTNAHYDPAKRQQHGHIATNGSLIDAGSAQIYGDASTNGGSVLNSSNVTGQIRDDFYQELFPVRVPNVSPDSGTPGNITGNVTINAGSGNPTQVVVSSINLSGQNVLRIRGAADGSDTFVQIVVTGNISMSGQGAIILDPGVYLRMFVVGDGSISGNGVTNPNSPLHFQLYGVDRPAGSPPGYLSISGNGGFRGAVYAPNYNINMVGGGNADSVFGAFVGKAINMTGVQSVHYDEALGDGGLISDYKIVSWFEDAR